MKEGSGIRTRHPNNALSIGERDAQGRLSGENSPTSKARRRGSLRSRLIQFFQNNPDEELTRADMLKKFVTSVSNLDNLLLELKAEGILEKPMTYRLAQAHRPRPPDDSPLEPESAAQGRDTEREWREQVAWESQTPALAPSDPQVQHEMHPT